MATPTVSSPSSSSARPVAGAVSATQEERLAAALRANLARRKAKPATAKPRL